MTTLWRLVLFNLRARLREWWTYEPPLYMPWAWRRRNRP